MVNMERKYQTYTVVCLVLHFTLLCFSFWLLSDTDLSFYFYSEYHGFSGLHLFVSIFRFVTFNVKSPMDLKLI